VVSNPEFLKEGAAVTAYDPVAMQESRRIFAGFSVHSQIVEGPGFWLTAEIEDVPALVDATLAALSSVSSVSSVSSLSSLSPLSSLPSLSSPSEMARP